MAEHDLPEPVIEISDDAEQRIFEHGGVLYIWNETVGIGVRDCISYRPPSGVEFECSFVPPDDLVQVCLERDFPFVTVSIEAKRWPTRGLRVHVDGERWGLRGGAIEGL